MGTGRAVPITRVINVRQQRLREICTILTTDYPQLAADGIDCFAAVHDRLTHNGSLEVYLDSTSPEVVDRIIRKARTDFGAGRWVKESDVKRYLKQWMGDTLRSQIFESTDKQWRVYLRQKLQYLVLAGPTAPVSSEDQAKRDKARLAWRTQVAIRGRDDREPPYPQPFIRHVRVKHDGLGRIHSRYTRGRMARWQRKKKIIERRAVEGFESPLRMEIQLEAEEDGDDEEGDRASANEAGETEDVKEVSMLLDEPDITIAAASSSAPGRANGDTRASLAAAGESATAAVSRAPNPVYWTWGQRWRCDVPRAGSGMARELLALGGLGEYAV